MPSRVRVAGLIGGRVYLGRQILGYLRGVADSAGVLVSNRKKGATWQDILGTWEVVGKYLDGHKLYVIRERRGVHPSRSLFNQKLLGYRRNKKKKVAKLPPWGREEIPVDRGAFAQLWNDGQVAAVEEAAAPPPEQPVARWDARPARQVVQAVDWLGNIVEVNRN